MLPGRQGPLTAVPAISMESHHETPPRLAAGSLIAALLAGTISMAQAAETTSATASPTLDPVRAQIKAKQWTAAITDLRRLAETEPQAEVYSLLGFALRNAGDHKASLASYTKALALDPDHKGANEYLGELFIKTGELDKAKAQLVVLRRLCPKGCEEREDLEKDLTDAGVKLE